MTAVNIHLTLELHLRSVRHSVLETLAQPSDQSDLNLLDVVNGPHLKR